MTASARTRAGGLAIWSSFLALSLRLMHGGAFGQLSIPLGSLDELAAWADHTSPAVMALAVVRLAATTVAWYLMVATILAVVADVAGWRRLAAVVAALSPSVVRRLATRGAGIGLAAGALLAVTPMPQRIVAAPASATASAGIDPSPPGLPAPPDPASSTGPTATMTRLPDSTEAATPLDDDPSPSATRAPAAAARSDQARPPQATMTRLPPTVPPPTTTTATTTSPLPTAPPATTATTTSPLPTSPRPATTATTTSPLPTSPPPATTATMTRLPGSTPPTADGTAAPAQRTAPDEHVRAHPAPTPADAANWPANQSAEPAEPWTVAAGDSFWSIAEEVLTEIAGREPTDQAIRRYWLQLMETNRRRLADPANPDLLIPGQRLALPDSP